MYFRYRGLQRNRHHLMRTRLLIREASAAISELVYIDRLLRSRLYISNGEMLKASRLIFNVAAEFLVNFKPEI